MSKRRRFGLSKQTNSWIIYVTSWAGFILTFPAWLLNWISSRSLLGITLALSFLALIIEARNGIHIDGTGGKE